MVKKRMNSNVAKAKVMITGKKVEVVRSGRHPCAMCGKGVGQNLILCKVCGFWYHDRCSGVHNINSATNFQCPICRGQNQMEEPGDDLQLKDGMVEEVKEFC